MKKTILTGDRATGNLHLGHYVGSLLNRVQMQDSYNQYIIIADLQALTDNYNNPQKIQDSIYEITLDYLSVGISPSKTTIFIQSQIGELAELSMFFLNLVSFNRLMRNPTIKLELIQKANQNLPAGFISYPVSQAADISAFKADVVPVGEDQLPMIEQSNEIVRTFNNTYGTQCLKEVTAHLSHHARLIGINGQYKASKSLGNAIFLNDSVEEVKRKVFAMFTDPNHIKVSDKGQVKGNVVFEYLDAFYEDKENLNALKTHYTKGGLADVFLKNLLNTTLQTLLLPIREKRQSINRKDLKSILKEGTEKARIVAKNTLNEVRDCIGLNYFK